MQGTSFSLFKLLILVFKKVLFSLMLIVTVGNLASAQEMFGYVNSNYAGITGIRLNPTAIVNSKLYFDLNIIGLHINADNNFIYLSKDQYKFSRFLSTNPSFPEHDVQVSATRIERRVYYDHYNQDLKNAYTEVQLLGPSVMYTINDKAFGLTTSVRTIGSGYNIPYEIAKFGVEGFDYYPQHRIRYIDNKDFRAGGISFAEISATYAQVLYKRNMDHVTVGVTLKGLLGLAGAYWHVDNADYMLPNGDTLILFNGNAEMGMSLPIDYSNNKSTLPNQLIKGTGIGADIGITYQKKMKGHTNKRYTACEQPFEDYFYKIGFSLIDFGYVNFKKNIRQVELVDASGSWFDFTNQNLKTVDELFNSMSNAFGGSSKVKINQDPFKVFLPSAASIQFDYRYNEKIYINASIVYPLLTNKNTIARPSTISVAPRYETDKFELALPVTLYNYQYPRIGLSARFAKFVIGTDKLGGFFGLNQFTGLDIYFMVKLSLIKGHCLGEGKGGTCSNMEFKQYQRSKKRIKVD